MLERFPLESQWIFIRIQEGLSEDFTNNFRKFPRKLTKIRKKSNTFPNNYREIIKEYSKRIYEISVRIEEGFQFKKPGGFPNNFWRVFERISEKILESFRMDFHKKDCYINLLNISGKISTRFPKVFHEDFRKKIPRIWTT